MLRLAALVSLLFFVSSTTPATTSASPLSHKSHHRSHHSSHHEVSHQRNSHPRARGNKQLEKEINQLETAVESLNEMVEQSMEVQVDQSEPEFPEDEQVAPVPVVIHSSENESFNSTFDDAANADAASTTNIAGTAQDAIRQLVSTACGINFGCGTADWEWWTAAVGINGALLKDAYNGNDMNRGLLTPLLNSQQNTAWGRFGGASTDDVLWFVDAFLLARDIYDQGYLNIATTMFQDTAKYWSDNICGGGIEWQKSHAPGDTYKASISNALFMYSAARLFQITRDNQYSNWATKTYNWFKNSGVINGDGRIFDGIHEGGCGRDNGIWTYNSGVFMGALTVMYWNTGDRSYLDAAAHTADGVINNMSNNGILVESNCEGNNSCNVDQQTFKGVFMRFLAQLMDANRNVNYQYYINNNVGAMLSRARSGSSYDYRWNGGNMFTPITQIAAVDLLSAQILANRKPQTYHLQTGNNLCLDVWGGNDMANGHTVQAWTCSGATNQRWWYDGSNVHVGNNFCLDVDSGNTAQSARVQIWQCFPGSANQMFEIRGANLVWKQNGKCLDVDASKTVPGTPAVLYDCNGQQNQQWRQQD